MRAHKLIRTGAAMKVRAASYDSKSNTVDVVWTTGATVRRYDDLTGAPYDETLSLDEGAVDLTRLNLGAPFLDTHASAGLCNVLGAVVPGTAAIERVRGVATILLSKAPDVADMILKIIEGVVRNVSVGYWTLESETLPDVDGVEQRLVTKWLPLEISAVPIPADSGSQIRSLGRRARAPAPPRVPMTAHERGAAMAEAAKGKPARVAGAEQARGAAMVRSGRKLLTTTTERCRAIAIAGQIARNGGGQTAEQSARIDIIAGARMAERLQGKPSRA